MNASLASIAAASLVGVLLLSIAFTPAMILAAGPTDDPVDFTRDIRPILSQHCFACHGPDANARKAQLNLAVEEDAKRLRSSGSAVIVPSDAAGSELIHRIRNHADPMPPEEARNPLTLSQIDRLERWISQGASYAPHWAFVPPQPNEVPTVEPSQWPRTVIDHYILARLMQAGLDMKLTGVEPARVVQEILA